MTFARYFILRTEDIHDSRIYLILGNVVMYRKIISPNQSRKSKLSVSQFLSEENLKFYIAITEETANNILKYHYLDKKKKDKSCVWDGTFHPDDDFEKDDGITY